jgi:hypothetical protein
MPSKPVEFLIFLVIAYPPLRFAGRWMQRKGRELERGPKDGPR